MLAQQPPRCLRTRSSGCRRNFVRCNVSAPVVALSRPAPTGNETPIEIDVEALQKRLHARAKAMIQLEEQEVATRTKVESRARTSAVVAVQLQLPWLIRSVACLRHYVQVKFVLKQKVDLGEAWKIVGKCPELGKLVPEVAPYMQWNNGDVWTLEARIRPGTFAFKAVLRKPDGQYLWESGNDRTLEVPYGESFKEIELTGVKFQ